MNCLIYYVWATHCNTAVYKFIWSLLKTVTTCILAARTEKLKKPWQKLMRLPMQHKQLAQGNMHQRSFYLITACNE